MVTTQGNKKAGKPRVAQSAGASVTQSNRFKSPGKSNHYAGSASVNNFKNPSTTQANSSASKPAGQVNVAQGNKKTTGKLYVMNREEAENADIVSGNFSVNSVLAHVLFDCGASHSFISTRFVEKLKLEPSEIVDYDFVMPSGDLVNCERVYKGRTPAPTWTGWDLIGLVLIVGKSKVSLRGHKNVRVSYKGRVKGPRVKLISAMKLKKHISRGAELILCHIRDLRVEYPDLSDVHVVSEFVDVFPEDIPGMPPDREVEFKIDLVPGTGPIA
ncbi:uncharacterized protein LOC141641248 [Silene latifolia]|uniref:uncharacterized protein LOC141641248 n=1 Tax=Silene latifolia TaxID=37657 RepID=UPI003D777F0B